MNNTPKGDEPWSTTDLISKVKNHIVIDLIFKKDLQEGERIPPIRTIEESIQIPRSSVSRAIDLLVYEGVLKPQKNKGIYLHSRAKCSAYITQSNLIAVMVPTLSPSINKLLKNINKRLAKTPYIATIICTDWWPEIQSSQFLNNNLKNLNAAGYFLFYPSNKLTNADKSFIGNLHNKNLPVVFLNSFIKNEINITVNQNKGVREICELFAKSNCKRTAYLGLNPNANNFFGNIRYNEFLKATDITGLKTSKKIHYFTEQNSDLDHIKKNAEKILNNNEIDSVFCFNDHTANALCEVNELKKIRDLKNFKISGYDNDIHTVNDGFGITSVDRNLSEMGALAVKYFLELMKNPFHHDCIDTEVNPKIIRRDSL
jgi:DNA-binding LacI/PurR family transcriptional regulator